MNQLRKALFGLSLLSAALLISSCETEDPGPIQHDEKSFDVVDFDRLEMGDALHIEVEQGSAFSVHAEGDYRNLNDLEVYKSGTTLVVRYDDNSNRRHETYITITMPTLNGVNFSGASFSTISGFESDQDLDFILSGASVSQLDAGYRQINLVVSGASDLVLRGLGDELQADVSGASVLSAFDYPVREATIRATGASQGKVTVTDELNATASGASSVLYRGNPSVTSSTSGSSTVRED